RNGPGRNGWRRVGARQERGCEGVLPWALHRGAQIVSRSEALPPSQALARLNEHFDTLETRDPKHRDRSHLALLRLQLAPPNGTTAAYARLLSAVDPEAVTSRAALAKLPVVRKSELVELQKAARPFGGFVAGRWGDTPRVFASPGRIYEPGGE